MITFQKIEAKRAGFPEVCGHSIIKLSPLFHHAVFPNIPRPCCRNPCSSTMRISRGGRYQVPLHCSPAVSQFTVRVVGYSLISILVAKEEASSNAWISRASSALCIVKPGMPLRSVSRNAKTMSTKSVVCGVLQYRIANNAFGPWKAAQRCLKMTLETSVQGRTVGHIVSVEVCSSGWAMNKH